MSTGELLSLAAIIGLAIWAAIEWAKSDAKKDTKRQLHRRFDVSTRAQIIDRDVGPGAPAGDKPKLLFADGLVGKPDAVFKEGKRYIVGEYKSWNLNGEVRDRERFQIILYMGMVRAKKPDHEVEGRLVYGNTTVIIPFERDTYELLCDMAPDVLAILNDAGR